MDWVKLIDGGALPVALGLLVFLILWLVRRLDKKDEEVKEARDQIVEVKNQIVRITENHISHSTEATNGLASAIDRQTAAFERLCNQLSK